MSSRNWIMQTVATASHGTVAESTTLPQIQSLGPSMEIKVEHRLSPLTQPPTCKPIFTTDILGTWISSSPAKVWLARKSKSLRVMSRSPIVLISTFDTRGATEHLLLRRPTSHLRSTARHGMLSIGPWRVRPRQP